MSTSAEVINGFMVVVENGYKFIGDDDDRDYYEGNDNILLFDSDIKEFGLDYYNSGMDGKSYIGTFAVTKDVMYDGINIILDTETIEADYNIVRTKLSRLLLKYPFLEGKVSIEPQYRVWTIWR